MTTCDLTRRVLAITIAPANLQPTSMAPGLTGAIDLNGGIALECFGKRAGLLVEAAGGARPDGHSLRILLKH
jgi:hypothetical protein